MKIGDTIGVHTIYDIYYRKKDNTVMIKIEPYVNGRWVEHHELLKEVEEFEEFYNQWKTEML